jgi:hypothetical protein
MPRSNAFLFLLRGCLRWPRCDATRGAGPHQQGHTSGVVHLVPCIRNHPRLHKKRLFLSFCLVGFLPAASQTCSKYLETPRTDGPGKVWAGADLRKLRARRYLSPLAPRTAQCRLGLWPPTSLQQLQRTTPTRQRDCRSPPPAFTTQCSVRTQLCRASFCRWTNLGAGAASCAHEQLPLRHEEPGGICVALQRCRRNLPVV